MKWFTSNAQKRHDTFIKFTDRLKQYFDDSTVFMLSSSSFKKCLLESSYCVWFIPKYDLLVATGELPTSFFDQTIKKEIFNPQIIHFKDTPENPNEFMDRITKNMLTKKNTENKLQLSIQYVDNTYDSDYDSSGDWCLFVVFIAFSFFSSCIMASFTR